MIDMRCLTELHAKVEPAPLAYEVKCRSCTRKFNRPVFHRWTAEQIADASARGITVVWPTLDMNPNG